MDNPAPGTLNWRLSAHPITLITFLTFRISAPVFYLLGLYFTKNFVLVFIITILLLAADFYYLKNIAGRRLVGLRWWNEVNMQTGDSHWVFESAPQPNEPGGKLVNATDKRFFWLGLYCQPAWWVAVAIVAMVKFELIWLTLVGKLMPFAYIAFLEMRGDVDDYGLEDVLTAELSYCFGFDDYEHFGFLAV